MNQPKVIVGIDGSTTAQQAMLWAAAECDRRGGAELVLAHAGDAEAGTAPGQDVPTAFGRSLLAEAEAEIYESGADCPVTTMTSPERPVPLLIRLSEQADLVVVGSHGLGRQASVLVGSVAFRVAAHAHCPVAVVPRGWDQRCDRAKPVVVGLPASIVHCEPVYAAFAEARMRGVPVCAVRSWYRPDWTDGLTELIYTAGPAFEAKQQEYADRMLAPLRELYPEVPVRTLLSGKGIDDVRPRAAENASLLVLGSRFTDGHSYSRLGPTTARMLHRASCPVLVVGHAEVRDSNAGLPVDAVGGRS
jgi:nucleotide-binding universal stress UspA family protein